jgi:hypothetical protein
VASAVLLCALGATASAAIFPDQVGAFKKGAPKTIAIPDQALYDEYGLDATEQAEYTSDSKKFLATAWRFHDSTGAMAMFESRRPPGATLDTLTKLAVRTSDGTIFAYGNYVFQLTGSYPAGPELGELYAHLPKLEQSPLPVLMTYLPGQDLIPNSERYVVGPVSLDRFEPRIPPSVAAFHTSCEAQLGRYKTPKGTMTLLIFDYPTPAMAKERGTEFQKLPGAVVRQVGPLAAVIIAPPDADAAERVLAQVRHDQNLTLNEKVPVDPSKGLARLILNTFMLAGAVVGLMVIVGVGFGGFRLLARRGSKNGEPDPMILLHLSDK